MGYFKGEIEIYDLIQNLPQMPHQREFLSMPERNGVIVGGRGAAKSTTLCAAAILNAEDEPNGYSLIGRLHMPELEATTMKIFLEMVPEHHGVWYESKKLWCFSNGHQIIFKHLDMSDPKIVGHIKSMNLSGAYVDECTEINQQCYFLLLGCLRRRTAWRHVFRGASNPAGHDWVWRNFFDPNRSDPLKKSNRGITVSTFQNPFLAPEFVENLVNTYPKDWADRFIHASFADFSDLIYKEFTEATHCWDPTQQHLYFRDERNPRGQGNPPESWPVIVGIDIGSDIDPWAIDITAVEPKSGFLFQYAEVYGNSMLIAEIAREMKEKIGGRRILGVAYDYSNRQCALELGEHGISGTAAIKEVEPGLFKVSQYMHIDPRLEHPFLRTIVGSPRIFISKACPKFITEHSSYMWAKDKTGNPIGEPSHEASHGPDAKRYAIHTFRPEPKDLPIPKKWMNKELDPLSRMFWMEEDAKADRMRGFKPGHQRYQAYQQWRREAGVGPDGRPLRGTGPKRFQRAGGMWFSRV